MNRNTESQHEISPRKDDEGQILDLRGMNLTDDEAGKSFWEEPAASYVSKSLQTCITFRSGPCRHIAVVWAQGNCPNIGESIWDPSKRCGRRDWPSNERKFFCPSSTVDRPMTGAKAFPFPTWWIEHTTNLFSTMARSYNMFNVWKLRRCFFPPNFTFFFLRHFVPSGDTRTLMVNGLDGEVDIEIKQKKATNQPNFEDPLSTSNSLLIHVDTST